MAAALELDGMYTGLDDATSCGDDVALFAGTLWQDVALFADRDWDLARTWPPPTSSAQKRPRPNDNESRKRVTFAHSHESTALVPYCSPMPLLTVEDALRMVPDPAARTAIDMLNTKVDVMHEEQQNFNYHQTQSLASLHRMLAARPTPTVSCLLPPPPPPAQHQQLAIMPRPLPLTASLDNLLACALAFIGSHDFGALPAACVTGPIELPASVKMPAGHCEDDTYYVVALQLLINLMQMADPQLRATTELTLEHLDEVFPQLARACSVKWVPHTLALRKISSASVKVYLVERASFDAALQHAVATIGGGSSWAERLSRDKKTGAHGNQINLNAPGANYEPSRAVARIDETRYLTDRTDADYGRFAIDEHGWLVCRNNRAQNTRPHNTRCTKLVNATNTRVTHQPADLYTLTTKVCVSGKFAPTVVVALA